VEKGVLNIIPHLILRYRKTQGAMKMKCCPNMLLSVSRSNGMLPSKNTPMEYPFLVLGLKGISFLVTNYVVFVKSWGEK
jgi:hypothetical protein